MAPSGLAWYAPVRCLTCASISTDYRISPPACPLARWLPLSALALAKCVPEAELVVLAHCSQSRRCTRAVDLAWSLDVSCARYWDHGVVRCDGKCIELRRYGYSFHSDYEATSASISFGDTSEPDQKKAAAYLRI